MKFIKKFLKIIGITFFVIFCLLLILPFFFKDTIIEMVDEEVHKHVNADLYIGDIDISLITNFPNVTFEIEETGIIHTDTLFRGDTILHIGGFFVEVDIKSVFSDQIVIKDITLKDSRIRVTVNQDTIASYDALLVESETEVEEPEKEKNEAPAQTKSTPQATKIAPSRKKEAEVKTTKAKKTSEKKAAGSNVEKKETAEIPTVEEEEKPLQLSLESFRILNTSLSYTDIPGEQEAIIENLNYSLKGNFSEKKTELTTSLSIEKLFYSLDGIKFANNVTVDFFSKIKADLENEIYQIEDNILGINNFKTALEGTVSMLGDSIDMDLKLKTEKIDFKSLLSLVPVDFKTDISDLKTQGNISLNLSLLGLFYEENYPEIDFSLFVENAYIQYPDLPEDIKNINIALNVSKEQGELDKLIISMDKFAMSIAENPIVASLLLKTPMSDPFIKSNVKANIDFQKLKDAIPLDDLKLSGFVDSDISISGNISTIEKEEYEKFDARGNLTIKDFIVNSADYHLPVNLRIADFYFTPKSIKLRELYCVIGKSDFSVSGNISNYIPYLLNDKTLKGNLALSSSFIDGMELTPPDSSATASEETALFEKKKVSGSHAFVAFQNVLPLLISPHYSAASTTSVSTSLPKEPLIPENIDFLLKTNIKRLTYDVTELKNINGIVTLTKGNAFLKNLRFNTLKGLITTNGSFKSNPKGNPIVNFDFDAKAIDLREASLKYNTVASFAKVLKDIEGRVSMDMDFFAYLTDSLEPNMQSIKSKGSLSSSEIKIKDNKIFNDLGNLLKNENLKKPRIKELSLSFKIKDGKLIIEEDKIMLDDIGVTYKGFSTFDQKIDFDLDLDLPTSYLGGDVNKQIDSYINSELGKYGIKVDIPKTVKVPLKIVGDAASPKMKLDLLSAKQKILADAKTQAKEKAKTQAKEKAKEAKEEAKKIIEEEIDNVIKGDTENLKKKGEDALRKLFGN